MAVIRLALAFIIGVCAEMNWLEKEVDAWAGLNAERDQTVLQRIQDSLPAGADTMDTFRAIVNDPEWQANLRDDVMDMSSPKFR